MFDGSAILKPALARGTLRCLGCSSPDKFKKTIEKDPGLERRFQQVGWYVTYVTYVVVAAFATVVAANVPPLQSLTAVYLASPWTEARPLKTQTHTWCICCSNALGVSASSRYLGV